MITANDLVLKRQKDGIVEVTCPLCGENIGRIQATVPAETDPTIWSQEVHGELDVLAVEHEALCAKAKSS